MSTTILAWAGHYAHAGSDKVWAGAVEGSVFRSVWGKRGSSLQHGEKTFATSALAVAAFTKKQVEKAGEGYQAITFGDPTNGIPFLFDGQQAAGSERLPFAAQGRERAVEHVPAHVTKADEATLAHALADPAWGVSEKLDGERCLCLVADGSVTAFNSRGQRVSAPPFAAQNLLTLGVTCLVDGERLTRDGVGSYALFDCLELAGDDLRPLPYVERIGRLAQALNHAGLLAPVPSATLDLALWRPNELYLLSSEPDPERGRILVEDVKARGGEGVILRDLAGPYIPGDTRHITKCKFVTDIEAFCVRVNPGVATGSVTLGLYRSSDGRIFEVGNVRSGLRDADLLVLGERIERGERIVLTVSYLSARTVGLKLVEPRTDITRLREDRTWQDCVIDQLGPTKLALFNQQFPT